MPEPLEPHYGGGIIRNSDFSAGLQGWSAFGYGVVEEGASASGNRYAVARNRTRPYQSVSQKVYLQNDTHYTLSGQSAIYSPGRRKEAHIFSEIFLMGRTVNSRHY